MILKTGGKESHRKKNMFGLVENGNRSVLFGGKVNQWIRER